MHLSIYDFILTISLLLSHVIAVWINNALPSLIERSGPTSNISVAPSSNGSIADAPNKYAPKRLLSLEDSRQIIRALNSCPTGWTFVRSYCKQWESPRAYFVQCLPYEGISQPWARGITGSCAPNELCMDSEIGGSFQDAALCISQDAFYKKAFTKMNESPSVSVAASEAGLPSNGLHSSQYALEALLTSSDTQLLINASSMRLQAKKSVNIHGWDMWFPLPGGSSQCTNCGSISVDAVPDGTQMIAVDVILEAGTGAGNIFLGSWVP